MVTTKVAVNYSVDPEAVNKLYQEIGMDYRTRIVDPAIAEALQLKKQEVTPELIQLKQIEVQEKALEKWDGRLPSVTGGATPFIDVNGLEKQ